MKTLIMTKIAYYMLVFALMLQDTLGKIKSTLVLEIYIYTKPL